MIHRRSRTLFAAICLAAAASLPHAALDGAQAREQPPAAETPECCPARVTLLIVGGGNLNGSGINEKFIELAGGPDKKFVIVPTAGGNRNPQGELIAYDEQRIIAPWLRLRLNNVKMLHTADPKVADTDEFAT